MPDSQIEQTIYLPEKCPECGHVFSKLLRPTRKMQKKAMLLFCFGTLSVFPWGALLIFLASVSPVIPTPKNPEGVALMGTIIFGPGLLVGAIALKLPKVTAIYCSQCRWKKDYV